MSELSHHLQSRRTQSTLDMTTATSTTGTGRDYGVGLEDIFERTSPNKQVLSSRKNNITMEAM